jgi:hypothetical protein
MNRTPHLVHHLRPPVVGGTTTLPPVTPSAIAAPGIAADLKGLPDQHAPDLPAAEWRFSSDDLASGGSVKFPSDVDWTVRYGIRSGDPNARGVEAADMARLRSAISQ